MDVGSPAAPGGPVHHRDQRGGVGPWLGAAATRVSARATGPGRCPPARRGPRRVGAGLPSDRSRRLWRDRREGDGLPDVRSGPRTAGLPPSPRVCGANLLVARDVGGFQHCGVPIIDPWRTQSTSASGKARSEQVGGNDAQSNRTPPALPKACQQFESVGSHAASCPPGRTDPRRRCVLLWVARILTHALDMSVRPSGHRLLAYYANMV